MKLSKRKLKRIITEEVQKALNERNPFTTAADEGGEEGTHGWCVWQCSHRRNCRQRGRSAEKTKACKDKCAVWCKNPANIAKLVKQKQQKREREAKGKACRKKCRDAYGR